MGKANQGYKREKRVAAKFGLRAVPFSGAKFSSGREDAESDAILAQIKSSGSRLTVYTRDLWLLYCRASKQGKFPLVLFDGLATESIPEQTWVAFPVALIAHVLDNPAILAGLVKEETDGETTWTSQ